MKGTLVCAVVGSTDKVPVSDFVNVLPEVMAKFPVKDAVFEELTSITLDPERVNVRSGAISPVTSRVALLKVS